VNRIKKFCFLISSIELYPDKELIYAPKDELNDP